MNSAEKAIKIIVCLAILFAAVTIGVNLLEWAVGPDIIASNKGLRNTDRGSSAWGSGGSGWEGTHSAGSVIETAKSPVAHETTDPNPGHAYQGGQPSRQLKEFVSYDGTLNHVPNLAGSRPGTYAPHNPNPHNAQPDNFTPFPFDQYYQRNRRHLRH